MHNEDPPLVDQIIYLYKNGTTFAEIEGATNVAYSRAIEMMSEKLSTDEMLEATDSWTQCALDRIAHKLMGADKDAVSGLKAAADNVRYLGESLGKRFTASQKKSGSKSITITFGDTLSGVTTAPIVEADDNTEIDIRIKGS